MRRDLTQAYLIIEADRYGYTTDKRTGLQRIHRKRVVRARATRPTELEKDQIAVLVTLEVPDELFNPAVTMQTATVKPENLILSFTTQQDEEEL